MPSVAERIKDFLSEERLEREKLKRKLNELEKQKIETASDRAEELGRLIESLRPQEFLEEINEELLENKGVIKSYTGLFPVSYEETVGEGEDIGTEIYSEREPLSFVSLTWSIKRELWADRRKIYSPEHFKLFIAVAPHRHGNEGEVLDVGCWQVRGLEDKDYIPQRVINPCSRFSEGLPSGTGEIILSKIDPSITGEEKIDFLREWLKDNIAEVLLGVHKRTRVLDEKVGPTQPHQV